MATSTETLSSDEQRLAELGYKQELQARLERLLQLRDLVLDHLDPRRLLHDLRPGLEQRRPDRDLDRLAGDQRADPARRVLDVRARLGDADRGGIYYWASKLGGPGWGWFTGWFNLIGLVAVTASVDYAAAHVPELDAARSLQRATSSSTSPRPTSSTSLHARVRAVRR